MKKVITISMLLATLVVAYEFKDEGQGFDMFWINGVPHTCPQGFNPREIYSLGSMLKDQSVSQLTDIAKATEAYDAISNTKEMDKQLKAEISAIGNKLQNAAIAMGKDGCFNTENDEPANGIFKVNKSPSEILKNIENYFK